MTSCYQSCLGKMMRMIVPIFMASISTSGVFSLTLLSDLPTPSFLLDVSVIQRFAFQPIYDAGKTGSTKVTIPSLLLPQQGITLYPTIDGQIQYDAPLCDTLFTDNDCVTTETGEVFAFLHSSIVRARDDRKEHEDSKTFIAELDLPPSLCCDRLSKPSYLAHEDVARLCLGLNNHHVGGYYWARSAGSGSAMNAPGVRYLDGGHDNGILQWSHGDGPHKSNTNDGKRSEWVNFLRVGEQVQLIPIWAEESLVEFIKRFDFMGEGECIRVFGVTAEGRPMGSDPLVVCEFRCDV